MNNQIKFDRVTYFLIVLVTIFNSACKKENSYSSDGTSTTTSDYIAVAAAAATVSATVNDSIYLVQPCGRGYTRDTIAQTSLPADITSYLETNYSGYTFNKAFSISDSQENIAGYVVIIYYNDKPVGLEFESTGEFIKTLEQREKSDLLGSGWHHGGRFADRSGLQKDTVSLAALPSSVLSYLAENYGADTLLSAFRNRDSSLLILSNNNGLFATVFDVEGSFVRRVQLPNKLGYGIGIDQSALPSSLRSCLETTYPNYVFKKAFSITVNGSLQGYIVIIDANSTKYAVEFNATGDFMNVRTIW